MYNLKCKSARVYVDRVYVKVYEWSVLIFIDGIGGDG